MKITTLNANGLRSADRRGFRDWLARTEPDVLCLQEIRADQACLDPALWAPPGWTTAWHPAQKKGYSGTAVWVRDAHPATFTVGSGHGRGDDEGRVVGAHLAGMDVWSVYLPSGSSGPERQAWKYEYMEHMWEWLAARLASGRPSLVCGDINIAHTAMDIKNAKPNEKNSGFLPEERAWMTRLFATGWQDAFRVANPTTVAYSWWSQRGNARANDVGWRIDYLFATPGVKVVESFIDRGASLSDHAPVSAVVSV
ncbi:MAG: exodeoxyribonuclease III [Pseudomonadota bacterium]|nr:exodeoxyribonuclease III [Pseudomonadota bacterium]